LGYNGYGLKLSRVGAARQKESLRRWIETILDAQKEDGHWISPPPEIDSDISDLHTTILAVGALIQYDKMRSFFRFPERARESIDASTNNKFR